jgi:fimbrial chaperone protein
MTFTILRHAAPLLLVLSLLPQSGLAAPEAKLQVYPTRITLEEGDVSAEVTVYNGGSASGRYRAEMEDLIMPEEGALQKAAPGQAEFSAQEYIRITPRSITVPPGQSQKFRLLARMPRSLPDGEYRTHLSIVMSSNNLEADQKKAQGGGQGIRLSIEPRIGLSMPVVLRKGVTNFTAKITDVQLSPLGDKVQGRVIMEAEGNQSAEGTMVVTFEKGGQVYELYRASYMMVYRGVKRRIQTMTLSVPEGVILSGGVLTATYLNQKDESVISQKSVNL